MPANKKPILYAYTFLVALCALGASMITNAQSEGGPSLDAVLRTSQGQEIPAGAFGIVIVEDAREASLLQLRGIAGSGVALLRNPGGADCLSVPLRFVAGDFGGDSISTAQARTIRLNINSASLAWALIAGEDVVSDHFRVGDSPQHDISIQEGLTAGHGFVLNPGTSLVSDIFGATPGRISCSTR
ncbi:hypothetical protein [uncultured Hoeflea sp.]|uniref:hypothetical protein n=1 Tax=uncultured Hoeflea sp. TaxID=538666 RepID=UPI00261FC3CB|nr:hypothetical protein [uncultured Hoeflea sp.]